MPIRLLTRMRNLNKVSSSSSSSLSEAEIKVHNDESTQKRVRIAALTNEATAATEQSKHVSFSFVEVRQHQLILGDNPYAEIPLGLGWDFNVTPPASVDEFEKEYHESPDYKIAKELEPLDLAERQSRLRGVGYTNEQIRQEERMRRINLVMEWAYRRNRGEPAATCPNGAVIFKRYVM